MLPAEGDTATAEPGSGRIEQGAPAGGDTLVLEGWAVNVTRRAPADLVVIAADRPDGTWESIAFGQVDPTLPLEYLGVGADPRRRGGWRIEVPTADIPAGATRLSA